MRDDAPTVESALRLHPAVKDCAVAPRGDRLVAYVVLAVEQDRDAAAVRVDEWRQVWDGLYRGGRSVADPALDTVGWSDAVTRAPIPPDDMREWADATARRVLAAAPARVLEIGCGTGMVLFRVAPHVERYVATDASGAAIDGLERALAARPLPQVRLLRRAAHELEDLEPRSFDAVVINAVIQHFPGGDYLLRVLRDAARLVTERGKIHAGDVRNLRILEAFHASVQLDRAAPEVPVDILRHRVRAHLAFEQELVLDPDFFRALEGRLPGLGRAEVQLKRGRRANEMTRFRYDVVLHMGPRPADRGDERRIDWREASLSLAALERILRGSRPARLLVTRIPSTRVAREVGLLELLAKSPGAATVRDLRLALAAARGEDPEDVRDLAEHAGCAVEIDGSAGHDGSFDARLTRPGHEPTANAAPPPARPLDAYANRPLASPTEPPITAELRRFLEERLPRHALPERWVFLDALPDRDRLPPARLRPALAPGYEAPREGPEERLATIFEEVLEIDLAGRQDGFLDLGGTPALAAEIAARAQAAGLALAPEMLLENRTIAALAALLAR